MSIREAFSTLEISTKQQMALEATLRGVDLETVFTMMDTAAELLVAILDDDRVPAEVRLEYYAKFVATMARPSGIIKFNGPLAGNEAWETCTESIKASRTEERSDGKKSENL